MRKTKILAIFALLLVLGLTGAAMADQASGDLTVEAKLMTTEITSWPANTDPLNEYQFDFTISQNSRLDDGSGDSLDQVLIELYADGHELDPENHQHIVITFDDMGWTGDSALTGYSTDTWEEVGAMISWNGMILISFFSDCYALGWTIKVTAIQVDLDEVSDSEIFTMSSYMSMSLLDSDFSFGPVAEGAIGMALILPDQGDGFYLRVLVSANVQIRIMIGITHFWYETNSISYYRFYNSATDDYATAEPCTEGPAGSLQLANSGPILGDNIETPIFLWVTVPTGMAAGLYTGTLYVTIEVI